ncbi:MAG: FAD-dependent oxidoreductase [Rickettsiales bacterium]|jgi:thioredoxin reductase (NADPH)|nr:FAD-dependent oxidoreductase [Rickettsiales bacterium]
MKECDALIIGSGPAGNTAAIYLARSGFKTIIATGAEVGGQLTFAADIENFPGFPSPIKGGDLMGLMLEQSQKFGVEIVYDAIAGVDFSKRPFLCKGENGEIFRAKNVLIAVGAKAKYLGLEGEKKYAGHGVSVCATCDGNFFRNKVTAVIGGGNVAGIEAIHLSNLASKVYLIYRGEKFFRMEKTIIDRISGCPSIECIFNSEATKIIGAENPPRVEAVEIINKKTNKKTLINLSGIFIAIGREPNTAVFAGSGLILDELGYVTTAPNSAKTNIPGVYAAGDVAQRKFKQAVLAAGWGCMAAMEMAEDNF